MSDLDVIENGAAVLVEYAKLGKGILANKTGAEIVRSFISQLKANGADRAAKLAEEAGPILDAILSTAAKYPSGGES